MTAYYNDNDKHAAAWLKELIAAGMITKGDVDDRSISDVKTADLKGYSRVHFFAGIGGWDYALRLAGWPSERYVWTGSCPCQPISGAGQRKGEKDERHLWPEFHRLIKECRPSTVFGEQVASNDGREWFAGVRADLEALEYAVGGADLCAAGEGAPHIRQRLFWLADCQSCDRRLSVCREKPRHEDIEPIGISASGRMGDTNTNGLQTWIHRYRSRACATEPSEGETIARHSDYWANSILITCGDGKARRIEPGISPLVDGFPGRVGLLRGYGNAIVPQVAAKFIRAFMECK